MALLAFTAPLGSRSLTPAVAASSSAVSVPLHPVFVTQPTDTSVSAVINPAGGVRVQVKTPFGIPVSGRNVRMSLGTTPPGSGTLQGTLTRTTDAAGVATFDDLRIDWLGHGYTLTASVSPSSAPASVASTPFDELRVGDPCLGPELPACASACADSDGDGLNDAWETAGGVDMNGDGVVTDPAHDLMLAGADPKAPDIFVQYDWMDYALPGNYCTTDADCMHWGGNHLGETCTGPHINHVGTHSCRYACNADLDCTSRGQGHAGEVCGSGSCLHTHDPEQLTPAALPAVTDSFATHGIHLHLIRGHALPHSTVVSQRQLEELSNSCEGGSPGSGDAGPGLYAESFYDLKPKSSPDTANIAYHYAIFGHYSSCDKSAHCKLCPWALNPDGSFKGIPSVGGQSGIAEIEGNDLIVSLGDQYQDVGWRHTATQIGGTFMHELGHNLGLQHGGGDDDPYKPNYLSVMSYRYQFAGILSAAEVGSDKPILCMTDADCPTHDFCQRRECVRLDYSRQTLPTGGNTPGSLDESTSDGHLGLNEPAGLGSGTADLFTFNDAQCDLPWTLAASDGPVDWNADEDTTDTSVAADVDYGTGEPGGPLCGEQLTLVPGFTDWPDMGGHFTYKFQCTSPGADLVGPGRFAHSELSAEMAMAAHVALPMHQARVLVQPGCDNRTVSPGQAGTVSVALLGEADFDVREVDPASLRFARATALSTSVRDVDGDGRLDLVASFDQQRLVLHPGALKARLQGWLKSSQVFAGEDDVCVAASPNEASEPGVHAVGGATEASCR
jgi:hypothetical protein